MIHADTFLLQSFDQNNKIDIRKHKNTKMHLLHYHDCIEMTIVPYGTGIHFVNGNEYPIDENHFAIFCENDCHSIYGLSKKNCIYNLMLNTNFISKKQLEYLNSIKSAKICNLEKEQASQIIYLFDTIKSSQNAYPDQFYKNIIDCILTIFSNAFKDTPLKFYTDNTTNTLQQVLSYINTNFKEAISLQSIARKFGYSISNLSEHFHKSTGLPFVEYVNNIRINYAKRLLRFSDYSITNICYESGFNSMASFSRNFKNIVGVSPSQFRSLYSNN